MSSRARLAVVAGALLALVVAFLALRPSDAEEADPAREAATAPAATATTPAGTTPTTTPPATTPPPRPAVPTIRVRGGRPVGGVKKLRVESGDDIVFRIRSDIAEEVHVHGYDEYVDLRPGRTATVRIRNAKLEGVFEVELHGSATPIAELRVSPS